MKQGQINMKEMSHNDGLREMAISIMSDQDKKKDVVAGTEQIDMLYDYTAEKMMLDIEGDSTHEPNKIAHSQIGSFLEIPSRYYERMRIDAPGLLAKNVNHWMPQNKKRRLVRTMEGTARAFLSDRYRILDNTEVIGAFLPVLNEIPELRIQSFDVTETKLYFKGSFPMIQAEIKKGDVVEAGICLTNSEVGAGSVSVSPFVLRLVCLNGMKVDASKDFGLKKYHIGRVMGEGREAIQYFKDDTLRADDEAFLLKLRDVVTGIATEDSFKQIVNRMQESTEKKIEGDVVKSVEVLQKKKGLTDDERSNVLTHLIEGGDLSQWGIANAVTRTSQDIESYDRASDLERFGGEIIDMAAGDWKEVATAK
jgi:hypothetical protein